MVADCTGVLPQVKLSTISFPNGGAMVGLHLLEDLPKVGGCALKARGTSQAEKAHSTFQKAGISWLHRDRIDSTADDAREPHGAGSDGP